MTLTVFRLGKHVHREQLFSGQGGLYASCRWSRRGRPIVYTSASISLAVLECTGNYRRRGWVPATVLGRASIPGSVRVETVSTDELPPKWFSADPPPQLQKIGGQWLERGEAVARMAAANKHLSEDQARHLAVHGVRLHSGGYGWKYDPVCGAFLPEDFSVDLAAFWREVTAPTLVCRGAESWTANPEADGQSAHFRTHRNLVFEKAGHWLHHDQLDTFLAALRGFL